MNQFIEQFSNIISQGQYPILRLIIKDTRLTTKFLRNSFITDLVCELTLNNHNVDLLLVHYFELEYSIFQEKNIHFSTFSLFAPDLEGIMDRFWQLETLVKIPMGTLPIIVLKDLEDLFVVLENKIDRVENILTTLIQMNVPVVILSFDSTYGHSDPPYHSIFRNFKIFDLSISLPNSHI